MSRNAQEKTGSNRDNRRSLWRFRQHHNEFTLHPDFQLERSKKNESLQLLKLWSILDYLGVIEAMIASLIKIMKGKDTNTWYKLKTRYSSRIMNGRTIQFDEFRESVLPFRVFLKECDKWGYRFENKGNIEIFSYRILISTVKWLSTCELDLDDW